MEIVEVGMGSLSCNVGSVRNALSDQSIFRWSLIYLVDISSTIWGGKQRPG